MKGYTLEKSGKINDSIRTYSEVLKYDKTNLNSMNSTAYLMAQKNMNIEKALEIAEYVYRRDRNNPSYRDTLGYIHLKSGNYEQAEKHLNAAFKEMPFNSEIALHIEELKKKKTSNS